MKHTYRIRVQPHSYYSVIAAGAGPLSAKSLARSIEGATVREIVHGDYGDQLIDLELQRPTHEQALITTSSSSSNSSATRGSKRQSPNGPTTHSAEDSSASSVAEPPESLRATAASAWPRRSSEP